MDKNKALQIMQESFDSMHRSGMFEEALVVDSATVILGSGSSLDSLGFVTFISDMEERVSDESGQDHYLILSDIHEFNAEEAFLSAGTLAQYIEKISE